MKFYNGSDLKKLINDYKNQGKSIDQNLIFHIVFSICLGLKEIHEKKIMHRDLKPENIFVTTDNKIKIGDFGISKQLTTNKDYASTRIGTLNYMALKLFGGKKYNIKVDIWAFGCIIYELFTLYFCFEDENKNTLGLVNKIIKCSIFNLKYILTINIYSPVYSSKL